MSEEKSGQCVLLEDVRAQLFEAEKDLNANFLPLLGTIQHYRAMNRLRWVHDQAMERLSREPMAV